MESDNDMSEVTLLMIIY